MVTSYRMQTIPTSRYHQIELKVLAETTMSNHLKWLSVNGMVCNTDKAEIIVTNQDKLEAITVDSCQLQTQYEMKVLGIIFDHGVTWAQQVSNALSKFNKTLHGLRLIKRHLSQAQLKQAITSFYFSVLYYGMEIWLHKNLSFSLKQKVRSCHYRALRMLLSSSSKMTSRSEIDILTQRASPDELSNYTLAKFATRMVQNQRSKRLHDTTMTNSYSQSRQPGRLFFYDNSKRKIGRQCVRKQSL